MKFIAIIILCELCLAIDILDESIAKESICFEPCPAACNCTDPPTLDCSAGLLENIPLEFKICDWSEVSTLNLSDNEISTISANSFYGMPNLQELFINHNKISNIDSQAFDSLESLNVLDLSSNRLQSLNGALFKQLKSLKTIYLYANHIQTIEKDDFKGLSSLEFVSLDDNNIAYFSKDVFQLTKKLKSILLYTNQITTLPDGLLDGLSELQIFAVHENLISKISPNFFNSSSNLRQAYMHNNMLTEISDWTFQSLHNLALLYLSGNYLRVISSNALYGLGSLHTLVLNDNQITRINDGAFTHTPNLQDLYMDNNLMTHISNQTLAGLRNLRLLKLGKNSLTTIADGAFSQHQNLARLHLFQNRIENITSNTFSGLQRVTEIVMNSNQIEQLPPEFLKDSIYLQHLWLGDNLIQCIDESAFKHQQNLQLLALEQNRISHLPDNLFQNTPVLRYLLLSSNNFSKITTRPFRNMYLVQLTLYNNMISYIEEGALAGSRVLFLQWNIGNPPDFESDNRLKCDCHSLWLQQYLQENPPIYSSVYCQGAVGVQAKRIEDMATGLTATCDVNRLEVKIEYETDVMHVADGSCVQLKCVSNIQANLSWSYQGTTKRTSMLDDCGLKVDQCGVREDTNGLLSLVEFSESDQGTYTCTAKRNGLESKTQIEIILGDPPVVDLIPEDKMYRDPPNYVIFDFRASGNPKPTIEWFHNKKKITVGHRFHINQTGSLMILDTEFSDRGNYTAVAKNGAGIVETAAKLDIHFQSPCFGIGCQNGGTCIEYHQCICQPGYDGATCEEENDAGDYSGNYSDDHTDDVQGIDNKRKKRDMTTEKIKEITDKHIKHTTSSVTNDLLDSVKGEEHEQALIINDVHLQIIINNTKPTVDEKQLKNLI